jgi:hypothetical protein
MEAAVEEKRGLEWDGGVWDSLFGIRFSAVVESRAAEMCSSRNSVGHTMEICRVGGFGSETGSYIFLKIFNGNRAPQDPIASFAETFGPSQPTIRALRPPKRNQWAPYAPLLSNI